VLVLALTQQQEQLEQQEQEEQQRGWEQAAPKQLLPLRKPQLL
jgi:hypothetical protein